MPIEDQLKERRRFWIGLGFILLIYAAVAGLRYSTPDDMGLRDQERPTSYMLDVYQNGNWLWPRDSWGAVGSKPPLHPWLGALAAFAFGGVVRPAWLFPSLLSVLVAAVALYVAGRRRMGWAAGLWASAVFLLSPLGVKMVCLVRSDPLFGCLVLLNALAALRVWERGSGWTLFWILAILTTLTKGPLGVVLAASGLLAVWWERWTGHATSLRGAMLPGFTAWAAVSVGWLLTAWWVHGDEVLLEVLGRELLRHAVVGDYGEPAIANAYHAPFYFLTRFAPWSFLTIAAILRVIRRPSPDDARRRFDRFLVCWILAGLVLFSFAGHQRGDLIFPLVPASALLAGGVIAGFRWLQGSRRIFAAAGVTAVIALTVGGWEYAFYNPGNPQLRRGLAAKRIAQELRETVGPEFPLVYSGRYGAPLAMQVYLGIWSRMARLDEPLELLRGAAPIFVATTDADSLVADCEARGIEIHVLRRWDSEDRRYSFAVVGNREQLVWSDPITGWVAPFAITFRGVRPVLGKSYYVERRWSSANGGSFELDDAGGGMTVESLSRLPATLRLDLRQGERSWSEQHEIGPRGKLVLRWAGSDDVRRLER